VSVSISCGSSRLTNITYNSQHRVSPFELKDPTKPGHRRFIALWLVDPAQRIISTANVPPQQQSWWLDSAFGSTAEEREKNMTKLPAELVSILAEGGLNADPGQLGQAKLPPELMEMVRDHFNASNSLSMSNEEAKEHRAKLMEERSAFHHDSEEHRHRMTYGFCEH
jgi:hypothetical protein